MHQIEIDGLDYSYSKDELILKGINLDIRHPQLVSIVGPNGVGKSTLIHCINRILEPTHGVVMVDEVDVKNYNTRELAKKIGYVPCTSSDTFPMTVVDTILMGRNPHRKWKSLHQDLLVVKEVMDMMDIADLAMRPFNELSAGQHQRVMLARGLAQEPEILLLDEPTANLDIKHQMDVIRLLKVLSTKKKIVVVMISHDLNLASRYSDNIIMMSEGEIFAVGKPLDVITPENIMRVYGVDSDVIVSDGRPFMIVRDRDFDGSVIEDEGVVESHGPVANVIETERSGIAG